MLGVEPDSAAASAGLRGTTLERNGALVLVDVVTAIDGGWVDSVQDIVEALDERRIGDVVVLTIVRAGRERQVSVTLQRER